MFEAIYSDMTEAEIRRSFLSGLDTNQFKYEEMDDDKIIVTHGEGLYLGMTKFIPSNLEFRNKGDVTLSLLRSIPVGVKFNNSGDVYLGKHFLGNYISFWKGNIEGVDNKRLLNLMISKRLFER